MLEAKEKKKKKKGGMGAGQLKSTKNPEPVHSNLPPRGDRFLFSFFFPPSSLPALAFASS